MEKINTPCEADMFEEAAPLDADELMDFAGRIDGLPPAEAEWAGRLFQECMRARMHEAELMVASAEKADAEDVEDPCRHDGEFDLQLAQVALDAAEWLKTLWNVGYMGAGSFPSQPRSAFPLIELEDVLKSSLFARIREGKRPLPFPPPTRLGRPWHELVEGPAETYSVAAEIVRDDQGSAIGAIVEGCAEWKVAEEIAKDREYVIQHRGKGPLYHLRLGSLISSLTRNPPRWERRIRLQERGGQRSYTLEWPGTEGRLREIPLRAATWERAESEAAHWVATNCPEMYGQVSFERVEQD